MALSAQVSIGLDAQQHAHVGVSTEWNVTLGGAADAWSGLGLRLALVDERPAIALRIGTDRNEPWIELLPHFSGIGALASQLTQRLLPQALDLIVDHLPASAVKPKALAVAHALGVYGTTFANAPMAFGALTVPYLASRGPALVQPVVDLLLQITRI